VDEKLIELVLKCEERKVRSIVTVSGKENCGDKQVRSWKKAGNFQLRMLKLLSLLSPKF